LTNLSTTDFQASSSRHWGETEQDITNLNIEWHTPTEEEIRIGVDLIEVYSSKVIERIQSLLDHPPSDFGFQLSRWLCWMKSLLIGISALCEPESSFYGSEDNMYTEPFMKRPLASGHCLSEKRSPDLFKKVQGIRSQLKNVLIKCSKPLMGQHGEDATETIRSYVKLVRLFMVFQGISGTKYQNYSKLFKYIKAAIKSAGEKKCLPRALVIKRFYALHLARLAHSVIHSKYEDGYDEFAEVLYTFSLSKYSQIRRAAQPAFNSVMRAFPLYKFKYFPKLLTIVVNEASTYDDDVIEGACQVLRGSGLLSLAVHHWEFTEPFLCSIVKAEKVEKVKC
jgi:proteasome activator subunit 4